MRLLINLGCSHHQGLKQDTPLRLKTVINDWMQKIRALALTFPNKGEV